MEDAYRVTNDLLRDRLTEDEKKLLDEVGEDDIIVVSGTYGHIHRVLDSIKVPYKQVDRNQVVHLNLKPSQTVYVNCPDSFPPEAAKKLADFVKTGGMLITTDWALKFVIEVGFPNTIKFNGRSTADTVVPIEILDKEDEIVQGFLDEDKDASPQWWLEGSSYPIHVIDPEIAQVLVKSDELKRLYGEEGVIVRISWGEGLVYHMISHFYLQRTETRSEKHKTTAYSYFVSKGATTTTASKYSNLDMDYGAVQSAMTSTEFVSRAILKQKRRAKP